MLEILTILLKAGLLTFLGVCVYHICKVIITILICRHPELSDAKVKAITKMMSKDKA